MAKKKKSIIRGKLKSNRPVKSCGLGLGEVARIKKNEQAKLRRLEKKEFETILLGGKGSRKKVTELNKRMASQQRSVSSVGRVLSKVQKQCGDFEKLKGERAKLLSKYTRLNKKLEKLYESKNYAEHLEANKESVRLLAKIKSIEKAQSTTLVAVNKELGFSYKDMGKILSEKEFRALRSSGEISEEEADEIISGRPEFERGHKEEIADLGKKYFDEEREQEKEEGRQDQDWVYQMSDVFWTMSKEFDKNEVRRLDRYETVTFEILIPEISDSKTFDGAQATLIASQMGTFNRLAAQYGSKVIVSKFKSRDGLHLKYTMEEI